MAVPAADNNTASTLAAGASSSSSSPLVPTTSDPTSSGNESAEALQSAQTLQGMLDGFKTFLGGSSDVDGVSFSAPSGGSGGADGGIKSKKKKAAPGEYCDIEFTLSYIDLILMCNISPIFAVASVSTIVAESSTGPLDLDYAFLDSLLGGTAASEASEPATGPASTGMVSPATGEGPDQATDSGLSETEKERADLSTYFSQEDLRQLSDSDSDSDGDKDEGSDSEDSDDEAGMSSADRYLEGIFKANKSKESGDSAGGSSSMRPVAGPAPAAAPAPVPSVSAKGAVLGVGGGVIQSTASSRQRLDSEGVDSDDEIEAENVSGNRYGHAFFPFFAWFFFVCFLVFSIICSN